MPRTVKAVVLRTAGTNCERETLQALRLSGARPELLSLREAIRQRRSFRDYALLIIPGGFSYGDDVAAGKIFANELKYRLKKELESFVSEGRIVIGICNGFQVLIKSGLLPGLDATGDPEQYATLTINDSGRFEDRWIYLRTNRDSCCVFSRYLPERYTIPVAHGEGKFVARDQDILNKIVANRQVLFQYTDPKGKFAGYPWNPNGSIMNIAGICNRQGNVVGLMPHPERLWSPLNHPRWTRGDGSQDPLGVTFFKAAITAARKG